MRPWSFDQLARVAETGNGAADNRVGFPPFTATTKSSQVCPRSVDRLNRMRCPSGAKHGQRSITPGSSVMKWYLKADSFAVASTGAIVAVQP
jgi:hypothetical protein